MRIPLLLSITEKMMKEIRMQDIEENETSIMWSFLSRMKKRAAYVLTEKLGLQNFKNS